MCPRHMLAEIEDNINDGIPYFARRGESARVITTRPERALSLQNAIDRPRHADGDTCHASGERQLVVGLDDEVYVVALYREVHQAKPGPSRPRERPANGGKNRLPAQTRKGASDAKRDVNWLPSMVRRARAMARGGPASRAPRAFALPAPAIAQGQLSLW